MRRPGGSLDSGGEGVRPEVPNPSVRIPGSALIPFYQPRYLTRYPVIGKMLKNEMQGNGGSIFLLRGSSSNVWSVGSGALGLEVLPLKICDFTPILR